jgi:hypothetical protein
MTEQITYRIYWTENGLRKSDLIASLDHLERILKALNWKKFSNIELVKETKTLKVETICTFDGLN